MIEIAEKTRNDWKVFFFLYDLALCATWTAGKLLARHDGDTTCGLHGHNRAGKCRQQLHSPQAMVFFWIIRSMPFRDNSLSRLGTVRGYLMWARVRSETSQLGVRGMCCCVSQSQGQVGKKIV